MSLNLFSLSKNCRYKKSHPDEKVAFFAKGYIVEVPPPTPFCKSVTENTLHKIAM